MRVCLVGHHVHQADEGVRNVTLQLASRLAKHHELVKVNIKCPQDWFRIRACRPHVIHFVLSGSSRLSFAAAKLLGSLYPQAKTVVSAMQPPDDGVPRWLRLLGPDLTLVQSRAAHRVLCRAGLSTEFLANGVDTMRFVHVSGAGKRELRRRYAIGVEDCVILHVGPVKKERNVQLLGRLQGDGYQVIIVGRASERADQALLEQLRDSGCVVRTHYLPSLEELYGVSDCYVFPTKSRRCAIELPLSVLEAMSCNLAVVSTRFGALPSMFEEGEGLVFVDADEDFPREVQRSRASAEVRTREKVLPYDWDNVVRHLVEIYQSVVGSEWGSSAARRRCGSERRQ